MPSASASAARQTGGDGVTEGGRAAAGRAAAGPAAAGSAAVGAISGRPGGGVGGERV